MITFKKLKAKLIEDAPANATGAPVVGSGDNAVSWKKSKLLRRKKVKS